jgi:AbrB family looped-hinge helix DNA binding protein
MEKTTLSSKFQFVIPNGIRKEMNAKPGQQFWVLYESGIVKLIPKKDINELFGTLKGIDSYIERDEEDRI